MHLKLNLVKITYYFVGIKKTLANNAWYFGAQSVSAPDILNVPHLILSYRLELDS